MTPAAKDTAGRKGETGKCVSLAWISWARRSRLDAFKRLTNTLKTHFDSVVRGMLDHRSNAFVEAMNGLMQQAKRAARGFRTAANFIAIAYLRLAFNSVPVKSAWLWARALAKISRNAIFSRQARAVLRLARCSQCMAWICVGVQLSVITQFDGPLIEFGDGQQSHRRA